MRIPECEILIPTIPVKSHIRSGDFFKIISAMETGAEHGMWTWQRYQGWPENKKTWHYPSSEEKPDSEPSESVPLPIAAPAPRAAGKADAEPKPSPSSPTPRTPNHSPIE